MTTGTDTAKSDRDSDSVSGRQRLAKNVIYSALSASSDVLFLGLLILSGRFLGVEQFGIFSFGLAATTILTFLTNLGLDSLSIRRIASGSMKASRLVGGVLAWKLVVAGGIAIAFVLIVGVLIQDETTRMVVFVLAGAGVMRSFNMTMRAFLQAHERFGLETLVVASERVLLFLAGVSILVASGGLLMFVGAFLGVRLLIFGLYVFVLIRFVSPIVWKIDYAYMKDMQREAAPLGVAILLGAVYMQADIVILSGLVPAEQVGFFAASFRLYEGLLVIPLIMNSVFYPRLASLYVSNREKHMDLYMRGVKYIAIAAFPIVVVGVLFSERIVALLYGDVYRPAAEVLRILVVAVVFSFCVNTMNVVYRSIGRESKVMQVFFVGTVVKIVADLILIYSLGIAGAGIAVAFSGMIMMGVAARGLAGMGYSLAPVLQAVLKVAGAATGVAVGAYLVSGIMSVVVLGCGMVLMYIVMLLGLGVFDQYELDVVRRLFRPNQPSRDPLR